MTHNNTNQSPLKGARGSVARGSGSLLLLLFLLLLSSCKDEAPVQDFGLDVTQLDFLAEGGVGTLTVSADEEWTVSCDAEWCSVSPTNGRAGTVCEVRVDTSYLYSEREAHLNFHCGNRTRQVLVSQLGFEKVIRLDVSEVTVNDFPDDDDFFVDVKVRTNVPFTTWVEYDDPERTEWLTSEVMETGRVESVPRGGVVRLSYKMYLQSDRDRMATIVFQQTNAAEGETPVEVRLPFRQRAAQEITPSREGDSLALITLSRLMHLGTSWDLSQSMIYWNNVKLEDVTYYNEKLGREVTEPRVVSASFTMFETNEGIPYHVRYLDQLRELNFLANGNAHLKRIDLGEHVTYLPHLRYLTLLGYGISKLPQRMTEMNELEELDLSGNNLSEIPIDIITALDAKKLRYINLANNRRRDVFGNLFANRTERDSLGLHGEIPEALFRLKNIRYIGLSYNYLEGRLPDMGYDASEYQTLEEKLNHNPVMPQLEQLSINLNFLTGALPDWVLYHPNLRCWDPYTLVFNQYERARDTHGQNVGFTNEPPSVTQACHLWDNEEQNQMNYTRENTFDSSILYYTTQGAVTR